MSILVKEFLSSPTSDVFKGNFRVKRNIKVRSSNQSSFSGLCFHYGVFSCHRDACENMSVFVPTGIMKIQIVSMLLLLSAEDIFGLDFYGKHVVKVWEGECNEKMKIINNKKGDCKPINTFIVDPENLLKDICKGKKDQESVISKLKFTTHVCEQEKPKSCSYKKPKEKSIHIPVVCGSDEKPVHYGKSDGRSGWK